MIRAARLLPALVLWLGLLLPLLAWAEPELPTLSGRVVDAAGLLSPEQETSLTERLAAEEAGSSNQIVVVTLPDLQGYDIADIGLRLGREWGIGQAGKDNGALLIVAPTERKVRIEVGYGLEGFLTDAMSSHIIRREILPAFRDEDYPRGIEQGVNAMLGAIDGSYTPDVSNGGKLEGALIPMVFVAVIGASQLLRRIIGSRHTGHLMFSGMLGFIVSMATQVIFYGIGAGVAAFVLLSLLGNKGGGDGSGGNRLNRRRHDTAMPGGFGGGLGGSGGFGGGGGGFGGGGASGGW